MNKKPHILFTSTFSTPFIREDIAFFQKHYSVTEISTSGIKTFFRYLAALPKSDLTYSWFASVYSSILVFFTKVFNKKSIIVLGGVDVAKIPQLNYGIWTSWWRSKIVRYGIMHADIVLAVSDSLKDDAMTLAEYDGANIHIVPTGYDPERWKPGQKKERMVLTVARVDTKTRFEIKGIRFLLNIARTMPDEKFLLIGLNNEIAAEWNIPPNLTYLESIPQEDLLSYYQNAAIYLQPSFREGLPNSLCEAMLCECYPIGSTAGGMPKAIFDTGSIVTYSNVSQAVVAIMEGFDSIDNSRARKRIATFYTKQKREELLTFHIQSLINAK